MGTGTDRLRRTTAVVALAGLLGLPAGCGSGDDTKTDSTATSAAKTASPPQAGGAASDQGMKDGCDDVRKLLIALDAGDKATAKTLKDKSKATFDGVVAAAGTKDPQLASNATAMSDMTGFDLPAAPVFQSSLAETYTVDCVAQYGAAALPS